MESVVIAWIAATALHGAVKFADPEFHLWHYERIGAAHHCHIDCPWTHVHGN